MKILHLLPGLKVGGQETMIINIANEQAKTQSIIVMIINDDYDEHLLTLFEEEVEIVLIGRPRSSKNPLWLLKLNYEIWKRKPDVVHSHYEKLVMYLIRFGYKFIYTIHGFTIPPKYLRKNTNLIAISRGIQDDVKERANKESTVIYNGLKFDNIVKREALQPYEKNKPFRILQVGRLYHEIKGQDILLCAVALLRDKGYCNIYLDFWGEGPSKDSLQLLLKDLNLKNVSFGGTKSVEFINEHLHEYNMLVQPSRNEGFGLSVAEAMAAKIPVITSNCSGLLEVVDFGAYGLVFENGNVEDCAEKIENVLHTDIEALQKRVDMAWDFANEHFNIKITAANYIRFYEECE